MSDLMPKVTSDVKVFNSLADLSMGAAGHSHIHSHDRVSGDSDSDSDTMTDPEPI